MDASGPLELPYITWGGDVATFHANGDLRTQAGSIFSELGLNLQLRAGDDFPAQVRRYMEGKTPFLRGTMRMIGLASEVIGSDPRTKGVTFLQLTWSAGDHMVSRGSLKTLGDLKGAKVALQAGGPHIGMLDDILRAQQLGWDDIKVVWAQELTGPKGPAALFRRDPSISACMLITPDMIGVTGGLEETGTGAEGTVKQAHVLVSTAQMSRSIADVYVCRKDFYDAHLSKVQALVAGYLRGCEEIVALKKDFAVKGRKSPYMKVLGLTQKIFGKEVIPTLEVDAHGLIEDCTFVGLPGNKSFFLDQGNTEGFEGKQRKALDLAMSRGYTKAKLGLFKPGSELDYAAVARLGKLKHLQGSSSPRVVGAETTDLFPDDALDDNTITSFTVNFEPDQNTFSALVYGAEFQRAVEQSILFGNAVVAIRGHSDPTLTLVNFIRSGLKKGILKRSGSKGNYQYFYKNRPLDVTDTGSIVRLVESGAFGGTEHDPRVTMQAALTLSRRRAEAVRDAIVSYAKSKGLSLDPSQIQPVGVGIAEPLVAKPRNQQEAGVNRRVEFRLVKVSAEVLKQDDFDY
ncbi:MAG: hypothetical protein AAF581_15895 [Planctomycetota bacterium]